MDSIPRSIDRRLTKISLEVTEINRGQPRVAPVDEDVLAVAPGGRIRIVEAAKFDRLAIGDYHLVVVNWVGVDGADRDARVDERGERCASLAAAVVLDVVLFIRHQPNIDAALLLARSSALTIGTLVKL